LVAATVITFEFDHAREFTASPAVEPLPLGETDGVSGAEMAAVVHKVDELLEIDPSDKRHLFYEEMKRLFYAMREIEPEDVDDESLD
jgi:hypothetical protein